MLGQRRSQVSLAGGGADRIPGGGEINLNTYIGLVTTQFDSNQKMSRQQPRGGSNFSRGGAPLAPMEPYGPAQLVGANFKKKIRPRQISNFLAPGRPLD